MNKLRLISSGFYPALRTPSFRHPKDTKKPLNVQLLVQKKIFTFLVAHYEDSSYI